ncbi:dihydropteroate synthase [bacterium]|nr:dihydropteroate synthase [bacterium]
MAGILNLSENSFSGDGIGDTETAYKRVIELFEGGADIIDIGAESTKPYSTAVPPEKQLERIIPLLEKIKQSETLSKKTFSIDTRSSVVAEECIKVLGKYNIIINDVSGGDYDKNMFSVVSKYDVPIIIQHSKGEPENMQDNPEYKDVIEEIYFNLKNKAEQASAVGVNKIILDVGIGFGKTREHNLSLIKNIAEFKSLGYPVMIGISRKSFMGKDLDNETKDALTVALNYIAYENDIDYIRVHNVKLHKKLSEFMG